MEQELFEGTFSKLKVSVHRYFSGQDLDTRRDIIQESLLQAVRRGLIDKPLTWRSARSLSIDAYRTVSGPAQGSFFRHVPFSTWNDVLSLADPPNQLTDIEVKDKMLSAEEQVFQDMLWAEEGRGVDLARERDTRAALDSMPLSLGDYLRLLECPC